MIKTPARDAADQAAENQAPREVNSVSPERDNNDTVTVANANIEQASNRQTSITSAEQARSTATKIVKLIESDPQQAAVAQGNNIKAEQANAALSLSAVGG
ncbi:MAG: hypothetical protein PVG66_15445 [Chromatiales bacterium]